MLEIFSIMLNVIAPIFLVVGAAALFTHRFDADPRLLSTVVLYLFAPFLALEGIAESEISGGELGKVALVVVGVAVIMALGALLAARLLRLERRVESAMVLSVSLVNAANYGVPLNEFAFGIEARKIAILYYVFSVTVSYTLGVYYASRGSVSGKEALKNVFRLPLLYAAVAGFAINLTDFTMPLPLARATGLLADASIPAMLVVLGMQLARAVKSGRVQGGIRLISLSVGGRLLIGPLVGLALTTLLGIDGLTQKVLIVQSSMPTAVMAAVLATQFRADSEFVTSSVVIGTLSSIITLSVLVALLGG
jgi:malate permease and related proteins